MNRQEEGIKKRRHRDWRKERSRQRKVAKRSSRGSPATKGGSCLRN
jgi:hypothetical protein